MAKKATEVLHQPPFPPLKWDGYFWAGQINLPSWAGFQTRLGSYGTKSSKRKSDGTVKLSVESPSDIEKLPPEASQAAALRYLLMHEAAIQKAVLTSILEKYPEWRESLSYDVEEIDAVMPNLKNREDLRSLIGLSIIHLLKASQRGTAYVGFELGCTWDNEHGLGVMTYKKRIVAIGGADHSFLEWMAENDAKKEQQEKKRGK